MNKQTEALRLALEGLEKWHFDKDPRGAADYITAIREALADSALDRMAENARELGLDYEPIVERVENSVGMGHGAWDMVEPKELAKGFHEAFAEPPCKTGSQCTNKCQQCEHPAQQQEPVAPSFEQTKQILDGLKRCLHRDSQHEFLRVWIRDWTTHKLTSPPASKPWVELTDEEIIDVIHPLVMADMADEATDYEIARAIEAKLKEKNA